MPKYLPKSFLSHLLICYSISIFYTPVVNGQNDQDAPYRLFDEIVGKTNAGIFNGVQHYEKYKVKSDKHQYFEHKFFIYGSLIYNGQPYFDMALKYDVQADELLIKNEEVIDAPVTLLNKQYVSQFTLNDHVFKNISFNVKQDKVITGFFEVLYENELITILKKYQKKTSRVVEDEVSFEFKDQFLYYIRYKNTYHLLKKTASLVSIFPAYKPQLKDSFKRYSQLKKTNPDSYLISVITALNKELTHTN